VLTLYELAWRPASALIGRSDAQLAHDRTVELLRRADGFAPAASLARLANRLAFPDRPTLVGGVSLPHPMILAAGLIKGDGFGTEGEALAAVAARRNIVPGWRALPALVGPVELGSFTLRPRVGNAGRVVWRDRAARSMQNRVGLRNPGARAAAAFLRSKAQQMPARWGVNIAVSPGVDDPERSADEIVEAAAVFVKAFGRHPRGPAWYTLNLSCPNTDDDPRGKQTGGLTRRLTSALAATVSSPVWVKVGPDLSDAQLAALAIAAGEGGARALVATNTLARPAPDGPLWAGLSGAPLRPHALHSVARLRAIIDGHGAGLDLIACGGILGGADLVAFEEAGARAAMLYSALVFRGPLAAALVLREADHAAWSARRA
jgi:dihydroorotate dehydrogenase